MPWDEVARQVPALLVLCFLVYGGTKFVWSVILSRDQRAKESQDAFLAATQRYMQAMEAYMVQVRELSGTCHLSHQEVADRMAEALTANTVSLDKMHESQHETTVAVTELTTLLRVVNGKLTQ